MPQSPAGAALHDFACAHRVCAELRPHRDVVARRVVQTGYDLALLARKPTACPGDPGCAACERAHASLVEIARRAVPRGWSLAVVPFEAAFRYRRETRWSAEIEAVVELSPPVLPPAESKAHLAEVRRRLLELGVAGEAQLTRVA